MFIVNGISFNTRIDGKDGAPWVTFITGIANDLSMWDAEHPERFGKLMPCCCRAQMVPDFAVLWHGLTETVKKNGFESIVGPTVQRWFSEEFKAANPQVLDKVRKMIRRTSLEGYLGCIDAFLGLALEDRIHLIRSPTRYLSGADDQLGGPPGLMSRLSQKVPGARHSSVPKAAHIANIQNPGGFNLALTEFLRDGVSRAA